MSRSVVKRIERLEQLFNVGFEEVEVFFSWLDGTTFGPVRMKVARKREMNSAFDGN